MISEFTSLHQFYCCKKWRELAFSLKVRAGGKCARCNQIILDFSFLIGHHTAELTMENVNDPEVSLNPENIEIICHDCHNKEHVRFGHKKHVYIVWGSPLSGKTTAVKQMMRYGDLVMDLDSVWKMISFQPEYIKPDNLRFNVFAVRDGLMDQIKTRYGQWYDAYIIGGYPDKYERDRLAETLGAELIYVESTKEECLQRLNDSGKPRGWGKFILDWWERFERNG